MDTTTLALRIVRNAREVLGDHHAYGKEGYAFDAEGNAVKVMDPNATSFRIWGAFARASLEAQKAESIPLGELQGALRAACRHFLEVEGSAGMVGAAEWTDSDVALILGQVEDAQGHDQAMDLLRRTEKRLLALTLKATTGPVVEG